MAGCEWEMEGRKGLLGIVKKGLCKRKAFGSKKGGLLRIATKGLFKWKVFGLWKREIFEDRKERLM